MGYGFYTLQDGREAGYMVAAVCDQPGCDAQIDRGLGYLCGDWPGVPDDGDEGCGNYYCEAHTATHDCAADEATETD
jgi:hypothetical protein